MLMGHGPVETTFEYPGCSPSAHSITPSLTNISGFTSGVGGIVCMPLQHGNELGYGVQPQYDWTPVTIQYTGVDAGGSADNKYPLPRLTEVITDLEGHYAAQKILGKCENSELDQKIAQLEKEKLYLSGIQETINLAAGEARLGCAETVQTYVGYLLNCAKILDLENKLTESTGKNYGFVLFEKMKPEIGENVLIAGLPVTEPYDMPDAASSTPTQIREIAHQIYDLVKNND